MSSEDRTGPSNRSDWRRDSLYLEVLAPGAMAGEYVVEEMLAAGGCGAVYRACHRVLGRRAAIKVLHRELATSPEMIERFLREARAVNLIRNPHIVDVYEFGSLRDGRPYFVMELVSGISVAQLIATRGRLAVSEVRAILAPLCDALRAAHAAGVVHRDLKASNVLVAHEAGAWSVKLIDFGIAKLLYPERGDAAISSASRPLGTPTCMAPEQIRGGPIDARTDVYALGVLTYQMLTGRLPFEASDRLELERQHLEALPSRPGELAPIPPAVDAVVVRALSKRPEHRPASAQAFLAALDAATSGVHEVPLPGAACCAAALYLDVSADGVSALDDRLLDDVGRVLDLAEHELVSHGYGIALQVGRKLLAARPLPRGGTPDERREVLAVARAVDRLLAARPASDPRVRIVVCAHVGPATLGVDGGVVGGALRFVEWVPGGTVTGVHATPAAALGLELDGVAIAVPGPPG